MCNERNATLKGHNNMIIALGHGIHNAPPLGLGHYFGRARVFMAPLCNISITCHS